MTLKQKLFSHLGLITLLIVLIVVLLLIAFGNTIRASYNPPFLRLILNAVFISATNIFVAVVSAVSFWRHGQISFALLSGALFASGLAAFLSGLFSPIPNATFAIFNVGFLVSSVMQAFGAVYLTAAIPVSKIVSSKTIVSLLIPGAAVFSVTAVTVLSVQGLFPLFVTVSGTTTDLRQFVVVLSFLFFVFASVLFGYQYIRSRSRALYWYAIALALFAVDTFVAFNSAQLSDALQWVGRISDYVGGVFFIVAFLTLRQAVYADTGLSERWFETLSNDRLQFASLFENMLNGFAYLRVNLNKDGEAIDAIMLEVNAEFERNTGLKKTEILGKPLTQIIPGIESDPANWLAFLGEVVQKSEPAKVERYMLGIRRWLRVSAYSPETGYVVLLVEDITSQKDLHAQLEQYTKDLEKLVEQRTRQLKESERLATIGQTAGMVGHDIRNPLQSIRNELYLQKLELNRIVEQGARNNLAESIENMDDDVRYINKIIQDLQDYTRTLQPALVEADLENMCLNAIKTDIPQNVQTSCVIDDEARKVMSDPDILRRIVDNLVINAIQAMPKGGKLNIRTFRDKRDVVVTVEDTGEGIPEDIKPRLFTPLFTTKAKGQGFGLAVVKRLTESLGGTITFESEVGKGTKFIVRMPQNDEVQH